MAERFSSVAEKVELVRLVGNKNRSFRAATKEFNYRHQLQILKISSIWL